MDLDEIDAKTLEIKTDKRGWLAEILKSDELKRKEFGQLFITTAHTGITKGGHYHKRKTEWFCVIKGKGLLVLEDIKTNERKEIILDAEEISTVKIEPYMKHSIKNIGDGILYLIVYVDEQFDPGDADTFS